MSPSERLIAFVLDRPYLGGSFDERECCLPMLCRLHPVRTVRLGPDLGGQWVAAAGSRRALAFLNDTFGGRTLRAMARAIVYGAFAVVAVVLLIAVGWVAALAFLFLAGCAALVEWLLGRADDTAEEHGIFRFDGDE